MVQNIHLCKKVKKEKTAKSKAKLKRYNELYQILGTKKIVDFDKKVIDEKFFVQKYKYNGIYENLKHRIKC